MFELSDEIIKILEKKDVLIDKGNQQFYDSLNATQQKIFNDVMRHVGKFQASDGRFVFDDGNVLLVNQVREIVLKSLNSGNYPSSVNEFLRDFDTIKKFNFDVHRDVNDLSANELEKLISPMQKLTVQNTINALTGTGIDTSFIEPMRTGIFQNIVAGSTKEDLENFLRQYILGNPNVDGKLMHYVKQISRDTLNQYDGQINSLIADQFGLDAYRYVGSIIADSRPQCIRWTSKPGGIILKSELPNEIAWMYASGTGSIPGTNPDNFAIFRGGYNCRHAAIPFKLTKSQRERLGLELQKQEKQETSESQAQNQKTNAQIKVVEKQAAATQAQTELANKRKKLNPDQLITTQAQSIIDQFNDVLENTNDVNEILNDRKTFVTLRSSAQCSSKGTQKLIDETKKNLNTYQIGTIASNAGGNCAINNSFVNIKIQKNEKIIFEKQEIEPSIEWLQNYAQRNNFLTKTFEGGRFIAYTPTANGRYINIHGSIKDGILKLPISASPMLTEKKNIAGIITHELAHAIQNKKDPGDKIIKQYFRNKGLKLSDAPSYYGETNHHEFWTESFTMYVYSNNFLKTNHPKIFQFVEDYLDEMKIDKKTIKIAE